jgi:acetylcholinesterase
LVVNTTSGPIVGLINGTTPDVTQFLGVPFAKPPTGSLRFTLPLTAAKVNSTIDATQYPLACPQYESASKSVPSVDARGFLITRGATSEDCLKASIWDSSPAVPGSGGSSSSRSSKKVPIIAWIYGSGFNAGGTNISIQIPSNWVQRSQKHIVISIQYRVNIFGFPNSAVIDSTSALNSGLLDRRLGLEWVQDNAAAFGGDASRTLPMRLIC